MVWVLVVLVVLVVGFVAFVVAGFNRLRRDDVRAQEALGGIDVQLTRRAELVPNLVASVKGYAAHESGVLDDVTAARTRVQHAASGGDVGEKAEAAAALDAAIGRVNVVAEAYPDLKASANFLQLQGQLADTENQLAFARQYYNDAAARLNTDLSTVPWMVFAGMTGVSRRPFYEATPGQATPPTVAF